MSRFTYQEKAHDNGIVALSLDSEDEAKKFAQALYDWGIISLHGRLPRKPIKRNGKFEIRVSEEELALIKQYNEVDKAPPEKSFVLFNPLIMNAAEEVRLNFMSKPYKGAQNTKLAKKDYDEFETIYFYTPPDATYEKPGEYFYRSELASHAAEAVKLLKRERNVDKKIGSRYEIKIEDQQALFDPAGGYELSTVEADSIDNIDEQAFIKEWLKGARQDLQIDSRFKTDTRFIAIQCKGKYYLYGMNQNDGKYKLFDLQSRDLGYHGRTCKDLLQKVLTQDPPTKDLKKLDANKEIVKDIIKYGKCFGVHPNYNCVPYSDRQKAWSEMSAAIRSVIDELNRSKEFKVEVQNILFATGRISYFIDTEEHAKEFERRVQAKLSEETKKLYGINAKQEFYVPLTQEEHALVSERMPADYVVRPNHGFTHSMRVAAYVPVLVEHYKKHSSTTCKDMDKDDVALLELAMLYSVVGRETEIGFGSGAKYEAIHRQFDNLIKDFEEKLKAEESKPVKNEEEIKKIRQQIDDVKEQKAQALERQNAESTEYYTYRKTSALAFLDYCNKSGFAKSYCAKKGENATVTVSEEFALNMLENLKELGLIEYQTSPDKNTIYTNSIKGLKWTRLPDGEISLQLPTMNYHALILYKMSDPEYCSNLPEGFAEVIRKAHALDLMRCYNKIPSNPKSFSIGSIVDSLVTEDTKECRESALNVVKYTIQLLEATGNRITVGINDQGEVIDQLKPADFSKCLPASNSAQQCVQLMDKVKSPQAEELAKRFGYEGVEIEGKSKVLRISDQVPIIQSCSRHKLDDKKVDLKFNSQEEASLFVELMVQNNVLPAEFLETYIPSTIVVVPQDAFKEMQGHVRYKQVEVPKVHTEEDTLLDENGEFSALKLIADGNALVRNLDVTKQSSYDFNFRQLSDPINYRPASRLHLGHPTRAMALDRQKYMDMSEKAISDTVKDFELDVDDSEVKKFNSEAESKAYFAEWEKKHKDGKKRLLMFQLEMGPPRYPAPTVCWCCYGKDATGREKYVDMYYYQDKKQFEADKAQLLKRMVMHYGYYKQLARGLKDALPVDRQIPIDEDGVSLQSKREDFILDEQHGVPISKYTDRGKPANTIYTKKVATSLLRPDGKTKLFNPEDWTEYYPVGMLFDINKVHLKGERYIWRKDAYTDDRFWLGDAPQRILKDPRYKWGENITLEQLKEELRKQAEDGSLPSDWNELMVGLTKAAMKGLFVQDNYPASRLAMVGMGQRIKAEHGIDVPMMIVDGSNPPKMYLEKDLKEDLEKLFKAKESNDFSALFSGKKSTKKQNDMMEAFLKQIDYDNLKSTYPDMGARVAAGLERIRMIGGLAREREFLDKHWKEGDEKVQDMLLKRAMTLGHMELVGEIQARLGNKKMIQEVENYLGDNTNLDKVKDIIAQHALDVKKLKEEMDNCLTQFPFIAQELADLQVKLKNKQEKMNKAREAVAELMEKDLGAKGIKFADKDKKFVGEFIERFDNVGFDIIQKNNDEASAANEAFTLKLNDKLHELTDNIEMMVIDHVAKLKLKIGEFVIGNNIDLSKEQINQLGLTKLDQIANHIKGKYDPAAVIEQIALLEREFERVKNNVRNIPEKKGFFTFHKTALDRKKEEFGNDIDEMLEAFKATVGGLTPDLKALQEGVEKYEEHPVIFEAAKKASV